MYKGIKLLVPLGLFLWTIPLWGQKGHTHSHSQKVEFPDIPGYITLECDFHIHTVFSDGSVWPDIRVQEAEREDLDAVSMTDHLEYQPHKADIPHPDRNRSYEVAKASVKAPSGLLVVRGAEVTRSMPPGHANAIFIEDVNKLMDEDPIAVFREAKSQGAFIFWNHPNWTSQRADGIARLDEMHLQLIREGLLNGIEVVNDLTYSAEALAIALEHNLTIMGTSDIHGLVDWQYDLPGGGHRPLTLVFATEKSEAGIKEALEQGRTVAWFHDLLIGKEENLKPLIGASLLVRSATYPGKHDVLNVEIENITDVRFSLKNMSEYTLHAHSDMVTIEPYSTQKVEIKTLERLETLDWTVEVLNAVMAPKTHPTYTFSLKPE